MLNILTDPEETSDISISIGGESITLYEVSHSLHIAVIGATSMKGKPTGMRHRNYS